MAYLYLRAPRRDEEDDDSDDDDEEEEVDEDRPMEDFDPVRIPEYPSDLSH